MVHQRPLPVEVITRILAYALASPPDDPQTLPSPRPHPVTVLLVCKAVTRALLPDFYRSFNIMKPQDWCTLFNTEYGVLGQTEGQGRLPPLSVRKGWVRELFLGVTVEGQPIGLPFDASKIEHSANVEGGGIEELEPLILHTLPSWLARSRVLEPASLDLRDLECLVMCVLYDFQPDVELELALQAYADRLHTKEWNPLPPWKDEEFVLRDTAAIAQSVAFKQLDLMKTLTTVHLPVDWTFMEDCSFAPLESIYQQATNAELIGYLNIHESDYAQDPTPLDIVYHNLLRATQGTPVVRGVVLVGSAEEVEEFIKDGIVPGTVRDVAASSGWRWLAPDGTRREPMDALEEDESDG